MPHQGSNSTRLEVDAFLAEEKSGREPKEYFERLIDLHTRCQGTDEASAERLREVFLLALDDRPSLTHEPRFSEFLATQLGPSDFAKLKWQSPHRVGRVCEILYSFPFADDATAERIHANVSAVLTEALHQYEEAGNYEQMLHLVQTAPPGPGLLGGELLRLRNRVHLYEMKRVRRSKRFLYGYLVLQSLLVLVVFPLLFVNAENGKIRDAVEDATDVKLPEKGGRQYLNYTDGLYWSIITAASIGYGDVTPHTNEGRIIAAVLGTMGVITIGVVAGLILTWITPRRLD